MRDKFKIYLESLQNGATWKLEDEVSRIDLDIQDEKEIKFADPFTIKAKAYLADRLLIINLDIKFFILRPCSICNEFTKKELEIKNLYITKNVNKIASAYDFSKEIINACFLEIPSYVECMDNCPSRKDIKKHLKQEDDKNYPFSNFIEE